MADMWPYWVLLFLPLIYVAISSASNATSHYFSGNAQFKKNGRLALLIYGILLAIMVGLRHEVGGDWTTYIAHLENTIQLSWFEGITLKGEPAYGLINWISIQIGAGVYGVNFICAFIFVFGLISFSYASPQPWLALSVAVPYLVIVVAMGYTRQGVAIGLVMLGIVA